MFLSARTIAITMAAGALLAGGAAQAQQRPNLDIHFVPTPQPVVDRMLELAKVQKDDFVIDLGSGDGRIPITAAQKYGVRALGVDLDPQRIAEARANAEKAGVTDRVKFEQQNLFETDIGQAQVLTLYLLPEINMRLRPRILELMKPGSRVVSHAFDMDDWAPDVFETLEGRRVYMWTVPKKAAGRWPVEHNGRVVHVDLEQRYQLVTGSATVEGRTVPVRGRVDGERIELVADFDGHGLTSITGTIGETAIHADRGAANTFAMTFAAGRDDLTH